MRDPDWLLQSVNCRSAVITAESTIVGKDDELIGQRVLLRQVVDNISASYKLNLS